MVPAAVLLVVAVSLSASAVGRGGSGSAAASAQGGTTLSTVAGVPPLLPGLPQPQALQGHDDENYPFSLAPNGVPAPALLRRYKVRGRPEHIST